MVKNNKFDSATESPRRKFWQSGTSLSDIKNNIIQALHEENISLKNGIETLKADLETSDYSDRFKKISKVNAF